MTERRSHLLNFAALWSFAIVSSMVTFPRTVRAGGAESLKTENVILITYDGLRHQELFGGVDKRLLKSAAGVKEVDALKDRFWADSATERREKLLPFFWETIATKGQVFGDAGRNSIARLTNRRCFSYPGYNEMLTGFADSRISSNAKRSNRNVTVLEWLHSKGGFKDRIAAYCSWDVFPYIINAERSGIPVNAGWQDLPEAADPNQTRWLNEIARETPHFWHNVRFDIYTFYGALEHLKTHKPRVLYVAFGETDDWAHDKRYDLVLDAAWRTDAYIRQLWETAQSMPEYAGKTTLILTTDHGRGDTLDDWTGHSAKIEGSDRIWIAVMGPDTPAWSIRKDVPVTLGQVAPTVAALLGHDYAGAVDRSAKPLPGVIGEE